MKKIIYIITGLKTGGAEMILKNIVLSLDKNRFEPLVISLTEIGDIAESIKRSEVRVINLNWKNKINILPIIRLYKIVKNEKPDIIHAHLFHANLIARLLKLFNKKLVIISTIHSVNFGGKVRETILKLTNCLSEKTIAVSKKIYNEMMEKKVISRERSQVIHNGVDFEHFKREKGVSLEEAREYPRLLSVGRLTEAKGYKYLVRAVSLLKIKYPGIVLSILGEGEAREKIENEIKNNKLEENVFLLGNKSNVKKYFWLNDIFVSSSLWEGLPVAIAEAMANGMLVVATKVGGTPEVIEDSIDGFLVESKNEKKIKNNFSNEIMIKKYEELYNSLLSSPASGSEGRESK